MRHEQVVSSTTAAATFPASVSSQPAASTTINTAIYATPPSSISSSTVSKS